MPRSAIHVYHESADWLADAVRRREPDREVIALTSRDALATALPDIAYLFAPAPPRTGWARAERLRLVQLLGAGVDQLLPSPDLPAHVEVAGVRGVFATEVAEHAIALLLAHARGLHELAGDQRARRFVATPRAAIAGERIAIVGHGEVGRRIVRIAYALELRIRAISRTGAGPALPGVELVRADGGLKRALADARFVIIAAPLTPATTRLFDADLIASLRADGFLINVARGGIVDELALASALAAGHLAGAALDVFTEEPLAPDSPLWTTPRLIITPHVAGLGVDYVDRCIAVLLANVAAHECGAPRAGLIRRDVGY
jgi:phosphoglycerate dehydrogenase-like enzyme